MAKSSSRMPLSSTMSNVTQLLEESLSENERLNKQHNSCMSALSNIVGLLQEANDKNDALTDKLQQLQKDYKSLQTRNRQLKRLLLCEQCSSIWDNHIDGELILCQTCEKKTLV